MVHIWLILGSVIPWRTQSSHGQAAVWKRDDSGIWAKSLLVRSLRTSHPAASRWCLLSAGREVQVVERTRSNGTRGYSIQSVQASLILYFGLVFFSLPIPRHRQSSNREIYILKITGYRSWIIQDTGDHETSTFKSVLPRVSSRTFNHSTTTGTGGNLLSIIMTTRFQLVKKTLDKAADLN